MVTSDLISSIVIEKCASHHRYNFLECQCENFQNKYYSICDICSENKFLRESYDTSIGTDSSSFSEE